VGCWPRDSICRGGPYTSHRPPARDSSRSRDYASAFKIPVADSPTLKSKGSDTRSDFCLRMGSSLSLCFNHDLHSLLLFNKYSGCCWRGLLGDFQQHNQRKGFFVAAARCLSSSILSSPICPEFHELRVCWPRPPDLCPWRIRTARTQ
jgi:hypothetical protein